MHFMDNPLGHLAILATCLRPYAHARLGAAPPPSYGVEFSPSAQQGGGQPLGAPPHHIQERGIFS
jgi:hypothetical protein